MALECKVLISKESGVKIEVLNEDKKTTQTFHMDGLKIRDENRKYPEQKDQQDGSGGWQLQVDG